jgi:hypothetical protein
MTWRFARFGDFDIMDGLYTQLLCLELATNLTYEYSVIERLTCITETSIIQPIAECRVWGQRARDHRCRKFPTGGLF